MLAKSNFFIRHRKLLVIVGIVLVALVVVVFSFSNRKRPTMASAGERKTAIVERGDISVSISGSGVIESASTKNISSEVGATVTKVNVAVGDRVSKGDVLFQLDSSDLETQIRNKQKSVTSLQDTVNNYQTDISNLNVVSNVNGYISDFKYNVGDNVTKNAVLFQVTDTSSFILNTTFCYNANNPIQVGDEAKIFLSDSYSYLYGKVSYVTDKKGYYEYGGQTQKVEIVVDNPGYDLGGVKATSIVVTTAQGTTQSALESVAFETREPIPFTSKASGTIEQIFVKDGMYIQDGTSIMTVKNDELYKNLNDAKSSLSDAYKELSDVKADSSFYTISAPIDGVVTMLQVSEGDYVRSESTLAKIVNNYDIQFQIDVDELDILDVKLGQEVKVTIDAMEETTRKPLTGTVSEIALEGTTMNSVTSYPITISLQGNDNIRMGMNCSAELIVNSVKDVLILPVEAIETRKGKYYVTMEDGSSKEVEVGLYNEDFIEIVSGLTEGDKVLLPETISATRNTNQTGNMNNPMMGGFEGGRMERNQGGMSVPSMPMSR